MQLLLLLLPAAACRLAARARLAGRALALAVLAPAPPPVLGRVGAAARRHARQHRAGLRAPHLGAALRLAVGGGRGDGGARRRRHRETAVGLDVLARGGQLRGGGGLGLQAAVPRVQAPAALPVQAQHEVVEGHEGGAVAAGRAGGGWGRDGAGAVVRRNRRRGPTQCRSRERHRGGGVARGAACRAHLMVMQVQPMSLTISQNRSSISTVTPAPGVVQ